MNILFITKIEQHWNQRCSLTNKQLNKCLIYMRKPEVPTPTPLEPYAFKARPARLSGSTSNYIIAVGWGPDPQSGVNRPKSFREIPGTPVRLTHYLAESRVLETHAFHRTIPLPTDDNSSLLDSPKYILILKSFLSLSMMSIWLLTAFSAAIDFMPRRGWETRTLAPEFTRPTSLAVRPLHQLE